MNGLYVALVHHPVMNRKGQVIASAITNLDLHDMGRSARTYDIPGCFVVMPLTDQQALYHRLVNHWCEGIGKDLLPDRERALRRLILVESIAGAVEHVTREHEVRPVVWATTANETPEAMSHRQARRFLRETRRPVLLLFGTGWGLAPEVIETCDGVLEPIRGLDGYNHLSVRCAAAIFMDRLLRDCEE